MVVLYFNSVAYILWFCMHLRLLGWLVGLVYLNCCLLYCLVIVFGLLLVLYCIGALILCVLNFVVCRCVWLLVRLVVVAFCACDFILGYFRVLVV